MLQGSQLELGTVTKFDEQTVFKGSLVASLVLAAISTILFLSDLHGKVELAYNVTYIEGLH